MLFRIVNNSRFFRPYDAGSAYFTKSYKQSRQFRATFKLIGDQGGEVVDDSAWKIAKILRTVGARSHWWRDAPAGLCGNSPARSHDRWRCADYDWTARSRF